jgi:hypothetical protein
MIAMYGEVSGDCRVRAQLVERQTCPERVVAPIERFLKTEDVTIRSQIVDGRLEPAGREGPAW